MRRRILLNFRIDQDVAQEILPSIFRPRIYQRYAIGGICFMEFGHLDGNFMPIWLGTGVSAASYRFSVEWQENGQTRVGNYVPRRESNSYLHRSLGDKAFFPVFNRGRFRTHDDQGLVHMRVDGIDDGSEIEFRTRQVEQMTSNSVFSSVQEAAEFFSAEEIAYYPTYNEALFHGREVSGTYYGIQLVSQEWKLEPLRIEFASSSFIENRSIFPPGSIEIDSAFIMRNVAHSWCDRTPIHAGPDPMKFCEIRGFKSLTLN